MSPSPPAPTSPVPVKARLWLFQDSSKNQSINTMAPRSPPTRFAGEKGAKKCIFNVCSYILLGKLPPPPPPSIPTSLISDISDQNPF